MSKSPSPERRHHVVYVTSNTEYHCRDTECVAVRDRNSGYWLRDHPALRAKMLGTVGHGGLRPVPQKGHRLIFTGNQMVMTSKLVSASRPSREDVFAYTSLCSAGVISA